jgi:hypothetical protein
LLTGYRHKALVIIFFHPRAMPPGILDGIPPHQGWFGETPFQASQGSSKRPRRFSIAPRFCLSPSSRLSGNLP